MEKIDINNNEYIVLYNDFFSLPYLEYYKNDEKVATNYYSNDYVFNNHINCVTSNLDRIRVRSNMLIVLDDNDIYREYLLKELSSIFSNMEIKNIVVVDNKLKSFEVVFNGIKRKIIRDMDYSNIIGLFTKATNNKDILAIYNTCIANKEKLNKLFNEGYRGKDF